MNGFEINSNDLPHEFQTMAETIGKENTLLLMDKYAGQCLYFPKYSGLRKAVKRYIIDNYDKSNADTLAQMTGVSRTTIFNYLNQKLD